MSNINDAKQLAAADTPILFFQCEMSTGDLYAWSSHLLSLNGQDYEPRILRHNLFTLQLSADDAMDGISHLSIVLGNADGKMSGINSGIGFKGAKVTVYFAFVDLASGAVTTEASMLFRGLAGDPEEITDETLTLTFINKLSLQRVALPDVRVQRTCPWNFPATAAQRLEALGNGVSGRFSKFYRCGYSADIPGGAGNLNAAGPFTSCDKSRSQCAERGMFTSDLSGSLNNRYGGFDFVPTSYLVRGVNDKTSHLSAVIDNAAKYNDPVPLLYGTGWVKAPVVFARNDGNLTHMEVLLGLGPIEGVLKVVVNDVEIPFYSATSNATATGWYSMVSDGGRQGAFNLDFADASGTPQGDPHGSMAVLSVVVPNAISPGTSSPTIQVLMTGIRVDTYDVAEVKLSPRWNNNPAWVVLDILQRSGWSTSDLNLSTFVKAASHCNELIHTSDINGKNVDLPRYGCNLVLTKRQSAASVVRGVRVGASLMLRYGADGLLELLPEGTMASQHPALPDGSNSEQWLNSGWPAYEFSDASSTFSGIARDTHGRSTLRFTSQNISETSNRISVEFQDAANEYQQDSLSLSNSSDSDLIGFEVASQSTALGLPNYNQAARILLRQLDKSTAGNLFVQFQTSFRAVKIRPGDLITISYVREGFERMPFRVLKLAPSMNYELVTITAQVHSDNWYSDDLSVLQISGRQPHAPSTVPRPLLGTVVRSSPANSFKYYFDFDLSDTVSPQKDGSAIDRVTVGFALPGKPSSTSTYLPLVSLSPGIVAGGGSLPGESAWYYAVTAVDASGAEGTLSFNIPALLPSGPSSYSVTLNDLSFPKAAVAFNVYRGNSPQTLYRIAGNVPLPVGFDGAFSDAGLEAQPAGPPDASFDHANIYYRNEFGGPFIADGSSSTTIECSTMNAVNGIYAGMVVRLTEGIGEGQERSILSNTSTVLTLQKPWSVTPQNGSLFVISEASWKLVAISSHNPAQFDIAYQLGGRIQVTGRAANAANQESNPDLAAITRMRLGAGSPDFGLPATPSFRLETPGGGDLAVFGVGFSDLTNVDTVTSGSLQLFYWNELDTPSRYSLSQAIDSTIGVITLFIPPGAITPFAGQLIQIDREVFSVVSVNSTLDVYTVSRAAANSIAAFHNAGALVMHLESSTVVMPFAAGFFDNLASTNYIHTVSVPDIRISVAQFRVTNSFGSSQASVICYASNETLLRTLSGGQFSLQVNGYLATQHDAAPPLVVQASHAVRDVRLTLGKPAAGYLITVDLFQNGVEYCQLTLDSSRPDEPVKVDGLNFPPLLVDALLTMDITLRLIPGYQLALNPGRDLTVTIRF